MNPSVAIVLRVLLALEFAGALGAWVLGVCGWGVAGAVSTAVLVVFLLTWSDDRGYAAAPRSGPL
jgi:hypothetical protein